MIQSALQAHNLVVAHMLEEWVVAIVRGGVAVRGMLW